MRELIAQFKAPFDEERVRMIALDICHKIRHLPVDIDRDNLIAIITKQTGVKDFSQIKSIDVISDSEAQHIKIELTMKDGNKKQGFRCWENRSSGSESLHAIHGSKGLIKY